jgi:colanic acid biosynthesis glycosyl transferase WcaI
MIAMLRERMPARLGAEGVPAAIMTVLSNWADADVRPVAPQDNPPRTDWGLHGHFLIGYSGNLGRAHMPWRIADLVAHTRDLPGVGSLFIGDGQGLADVWAAAVGVASTRRGTV